MRSISEFFEKIRNVRMQDIVLRGTVSKIVKKHIPADISADSVIIKGSSISLKGIDSAARSALFVKKGAILKEINSQQSQRVFKDMR